LALILLVLALSHKRGSSGFKTVKFGKSHITVILMRFSISFYESLINNSRGSCELTVLYLPPKENVLSRHVPTHERTTVTTAVSSVSTQYSRAMKSGFEASFRLNSLASLARMHRVVPLPVQDAPLSKT
jgi:hypothetical protein